MSILRIEKLINFLKDKFKDGIQMFDTQSLVNDYRIEIYYEDGISVLYAPDYEYIEIFGVSKEEFKKIVKEAKGE